MLFFSTTTSFALSSHTPPIKVLPVFLICCTHITSPVPTIFLSSVAHIVSFYFPVFFKVTQDCMLITEDLEQNTMDEKHIIFLFLCLGYLTQYTQHNISTSIHLPAILHLSFICSIVYMYPIFIIHLSFERYLGFPVF